MPVPLLESEFTDLFSADLPALEDVSPRDPTTPAFEYDVWAFVLEVDGVNIEFATVIHGGTNAKRVKGFSLPF